MNIYFFLTTVSSYIIHINTTKLCSPEKAIPLFEDVTEYGKNMSSYIKETYGNMFDKYLSEIIIIKKGDDFAGKFCAPNVITLVKTNNFKDTLNHELMHLINYKVFKFNRDWEKFSKFDYIDQYKNATFKKGFVTLYGMKNEGEDIATFFEEFMSFKYSKENFLQYDKIMIYKFKLLYKMLVCFNQKFKNIIKNKQKVFSFSNYLNVNNKKNNAIIVVPEKYVSTRASLTYSVLRDAEQWVLIRIDNINNNSLYTTDNKNYIFPQSRIWFNDNKHIDIAKYKWNYYMNNKRLGNVKINKLKNNILPNLINSIFE